jgi:hypothetical protein
MFNGSQSFYFSYTTDLTQSLQRQHDRGDASKLKKWQQVDDRFFWNKFLLTDLIDNVSDNKSFHSMFFYTQDIYYAILL